METLQSLSVLASRTDNTLVFLGILTRSGKCWAPAVTDNCWAPRAEELQQRFGNQQHFAQLLPSSAQLRLGWEWGNFLLVLWAEEKRHRAQLSSGLWLCSTFQAGMFLC